MKVLQFGKCSFNIWQADDLSIYISTYIAPLQGNYSDSIVRC